MWYHILKSFKSQMKCYSGEMDAPHSATAQIPRAAQTAMTFALGTTARADDSDERLHGCSSFGNSQFRLPIQEKDRLPGFRLEGVPTIILALRAQPLDRLPHQGPRPGHMAPTGRRARSRRARLKAGNLCFQLLHRSIRRRVAGVGAHCRDQTSIAGSTSRGRLGGTDGTEAGPGSTVPTVGGCRWLATPPTAGPSAPDCDAMIARVAATSPMTVRRVLAGASAVSWVRSRRPPPQTTAAGCPSTTVEGDVERAIAEQVDHPWHAARQLRDPRMVRYERHRFDRERCHGRAEALATVSRRSTNGPTSSGATGRRTQRREMIWSSAGARVAGRSAGGADEDDLQQLGGAVFKAASRRLLSVPFSSVAPPR